MDIVWSNFFIQLIAFLILYWLLSRYAFGPLLSIMEQRKQLVKDQLDGAEASRKQADQHFEDQKQALQQARKDANDIIEQAKSISSKQAEEIVHAAKSEATRLKDDAVKDIESEKNKAIAALRSQVSGMSVMIASKIIEKQIDDKSQEQLVDQYLKEVGSK
ncbi:ATP synthase subunit b [Paenibacillus baekrokdamisoli]|uniref:ATP synthase subunit b n=1 Tax=Paenibacillus baekrokdamisoli TaxID=1712516 RepID=A0A3G9JID1_9BACL|nr:F0F1 ATP synthase subunit B [Paenibacillus baekrokdamisoli]MBB3069028.1 F-type H+-transporting ATPase subunit b [Paenibacillus baekrokdamisoli]BBH23848.1 ATP synthase subunit b [Paenibacillus baekrokdamisoli]